MGKLQILVAIGILGVVALYGLYQKEMQVVTACSSGILALGLKILEKQ